MPTGSNIGRFPTSERGTIPKAEINVFNACIEKKLQSYPLSPLYYSIKAKCHKCISFLLNNNCLALMRKHLPGRSVVPLPETLLAQLLG
jgi:hypothetical protein